MSIYILRMTITVTDALILGAIMLLVCLVNRHVQMHNVDYRLNGLNKMTVEGALTLLPARMGKSRKR